MLRGRTRAASARWKTFARCNEVTDRCVWVRRVVFDPGTDGSSFFGRYDPAANELLLASTNMTTTVLAEYVRRVRTFRPRCIQGYAGGIYVLASYVLERGIDDIRLEAALPSSDPLLPGYRKAIEEAFGCEVFDTYGMAERTASAAECEAHNGFHVDMELCLLEVLDGDGAQVLDETGEIVGTNLENYAMPFIRYRTGDLGGLTRRMCPCGRESLLLDGLAGRTGDMIHAPDGRRFRLVRTHELLSSLPDVKVDTAEFVRRLGSVIGKDIGIEIEFVTSIPRTRAGKFRLVVSHVGASQGGATAALPTRVTSTVLREQ